MIGRTNKVRNNNEKNKKIPRTLLLVYLRKKFMNFDFFTHFSV